MANLIALLFILTCVYYVLAGFAVFTADKAQQHRKRYLITKLALAAWSLCNGMQTIAADEVIARIFWAASFLSFCVFIPTWADFLSIFTEYRTKQVRSVVYGLYAIFSVTAVLCVATMDVVFVKTNLGYQFYYNISPALISILAVILFACIFIMVMQIRWIKTAKTPWHKKQAILFAVLTSAVVPPAMALDMIIPAFLDFTIIALASMMFLAVTIPLNRVIRKQRLLNVTPSDIADDIFSSVNQPILALDFNNRVELANMAAETFWDGELIGKNITELFLINGGPPESSLFEEDFAFDDGVTVISGGETKICSIVLSVIRGESFDVLSKIAVFNDITELKDALQKANEASRAKTDFLAKMSHEIRTPMNAVIGLTELALREDNVENIREHIMEVKQAGADLLTLINDILDFSKIEANKVEIMLGNYSPAALVNDVVSLIRMRLVNTGLKFVVKLDRCIPHTLYGDEMRIRQAVLNLLSNAVKYTDNGCVTLSVYITAENGNDEPVSEPGFKTLPIQLGSMVNLVFEVIDTGRGMKPEDINELNQFAVFTQFDVEKNKDIEGVGLGLAITKSIIDMMGGSIDIESEYGHGSTFRISLPQKTRSRMPLASVREPLSSYVLIYEHRETYRNAMAWSLTNLGVKYDFASNEADLFIKIKKQDFNHLFVSYHLYKSCKRILKRSAGSLNITVLSDFGEIISLEDVKTAALPIFCTSIAEILNGEKDNASESGSSDTGGNSTDFTAPSARVLVVDDIKTNLKVAEGILKPYGMRVDMCDNGTAAVKAVEYSCSKDSDGRYDIIFMDHKMPGVDGIEATRRIRALSEKTGDDYYKNVPVIALTANAVVGMEEIFLSNGFNGFLSKPVNMVRLNEVLDKWIDDRKKRR